MTYMRFSIAIPSIENEGNVKYIEWASDAGFEAVESLLADPDDTRHKDLLISALLRNHMQYSGIRTGASYIMQGLCLSSGNDAIYRKSIDRLKGYIRFCAEFPGSLVLLGLMQGNIGDGDYTSARNRIVEALKAVCPRAEELGVKIALEPINRFQLDYHNTIDSVCGVIKNVGSESLGLLIDTFHMNIEERDVLGAVKQAATLVTHVHVADSNRMAPGGGHFDFDSFFNLLSDMNYNGWVTVEADEKPSFIEMARNAAAFLKKYR
jgi:5-keto-L-gluconate epimerase